MLALLLALPLPSGAGPLEGGPARDLAAAGPKEGLARCAALTPEALNSLLGVRGNPYQANALSGLSLLLGESSPAEPGRERAERLLAQAVYVKMLSLSANALSARATLPGIEGNLRNLRSLGRIFGVPNGLQGIEGPMRRRADMMRSARAWNRARLMAAALSAQTDATSEAAMAQRLRDLAVHGGDEAFQNHVVSALGARLARHYSHRGRMVELYLSHLRDIERRSARPGVKAAVARVLLAANPRDRRGLAIVRHAGASAAEPAQAGAVLRLIEAAWDRGHGGHLLYQAGLAVESARLAGIAKRGGSEPDPQAARLRRRHALGYWSLGFFASGSAVLATTVATALARRPLPEFRAAAAAVLIVLAFKAFTRRRALSTPAYPWKEEAYAARASLQTAGNGARLEGLERALLASASSLDAEAARQRLDEALEAIKTAGETAPDLESKAAILGLIEKAWDRRPADDHDYSRRLSSAARAIESSRLALLEQLGLPLPQPQPDRRARWLAYAGRIKLYAKLSALMLVSAGLALFMRTLAPPSVGVALAALSLLSGAAFAYQASRYLKRLRGLRYPWRQEARASFVPGAGEPISSP